MILISITLVVAVIAIKKAKKIQFLVFAETTKPAVARAVIVAVVIFLIVIFLNQLLVASLLLIKQLTVAATTANWATSAIRVFTTQP